MPTDALPWLFTWICCGAVIAFGGSLWFTLISFLEESVADDFGLSRGWRGAVPAAFYAGMAIGAALLGALSDGRILSCVSGRRSVALLSMTLAGLAALASAAMPSIAMLVISVAVLGGGVGGCLPAAEALFAETTTGITPHVRGRWIALLSGWFGVGSIPTALIAGAILARGRSSVGGLAPWRLMLIIFGVLELLITALLACVLPVSEKWSALLRRGDVNAQGNATSLGAAAIKHRAGDGCLLLHPLEEGASGSATATSTYTGSVTAAANVRKDLIAHICERSLFVTTVLLWAVWFGFNFAVSGFTAFLPELLDERGGRPSSVSPAGNSTASNGTAPLLPPRDGTPSTWRRQAGDVAIYNLFAVPGVVFAATIVQFRGGRRVVLGGCILLTAICTALFALRGTSSTVLLVLGCASAFFSNGAWASLSLLTVEAYPTHLRATGFGYAHASHSIAGVIGPYFGGLFIGWGRQWGGGVESGTTIALAAFAGACAVAGVAACVIRSRRPQDEDAASMVSGESLLGVSE